MASEIPPALKQRALFQAGIVTRKQALQAGMSPTGIAWRLKQGTWQRLRRGCYATFSGPVNREAQLWAAVLYAGAGAYLSHRTAAKLNGLADGEPTIIDVTIPALRRVAPAAGMRVHLSSRKPVIWTPPFSPPFSIAEETVLDLVHEAVNEDEVIALITGGFNKKRIGQHQLLAMLPTRQNLQWKRELGEIIPLAAGGAHSVLEYRHDRDVQRAHGLPEPVKQAKYRKPDGTNGYRDRYYKEYGLVIELDGKRYHQDDQRDRTRDNQVAVSGTTLRYGWRDVTRRPCETARQEADALRHRGWPGTLRPCSPACRAVTT
jgi:hypothetical protein